MEKLSAMFWDRWYKANELEKVDIVKELGIEKSAINEHALATLVNSFFVDLAEYIKTKRNKRNG